MDEFYCIDCGNIGKEYFIYQWALADAELYKCKDCGIEIAVSEQN